MFHVKRSPGCPEARNVCPSGARSSRRTGASPRPSRSGASPQLDVASPWTRAAARSRGAGPRDGLPRLYGCLAAWAPGVGAFCALAGPDLAERWSRHLGPSISRVRAAPIRIGPGPLTTRQSLALSSRSSPQLSANPRRSVRRDDARTPQMHVEALSWPSWEPRSTNLSPWYLDARGPLFHVKQGPLCASFDAPG